MTRKDFELIASVLRVSRPHPEDYGYHKDFVEAREVWDEVIDNFVDALSRHNVRFDANKFKAACLD